MQRNADYTLVGVFVVILTTVLLFFFFWLGNHKSSKSYNTYLVYLRETVMGLSEQSPVRYNGVPVGYVKNIALDPNNPSLVKLNLQIIQGTPVLTSTVATLRPQGITGMVYVGLQTDGINAHNLAAAKGEPYPVIPARPSFLMRIANVVPEITSSLTKATTAISTILNKKNQHEFADSLSNISDFTRGMADSSHDLQASIKQLHATLNNTSAATKALPQTMRDLQKVLKKVSFAATHIGSASQSIDKTMQTSQLMLDNFSQQVLPATQQTMQSVNDLMKNLNMLSKKIKRNPAVLVRGSTPPAPGPGEQR